MTLPVMPGIWFFIARTSGPAGCSTLTTGMSAATTCFRAGAMLVESFGTITRPS